MLRITLSTGLALAFVSFTSFVVFAPSARAGDGGSCSGSSAGHHDGRFVVEHIFEKADLDRDGVLSSQEYAEAGLERYGLSFEQSDTDGDGETSLDEYLELYEVHHPPAEVVDEDTV